MYSLPSQPTLSLTPANIFKLVYEYWHSDIRDCSKRFLCHTLVPEEVMSGGPCFCFLCLLCQRFPATSCTFSVRYCLWHKRHSQQSWHAVPEADFGILPWWLRGREGEGWHQCLAVLLLYLPNSPKDTHKHPLPEEADKRCVSLVGRPGTRCHFLGKFLMQSSATEFWFLSKQDTECKFSQIRQLKIQIIQYTCHKSLTVQGRPQGWTLIGCQNAG